MGTLDWIREFVNTKRTVWASIRRRMCLIRRSGLIFNLLEFRVTAFALHLDVSLATNVAYCT